MAASVYAHGRAGGGLHGILERGDRLAVGDERYDVLGARVPGGEVVRDITAQTPRIVAESVPLGVGGWWGRDGWADWALLGGYYY